MRKVNISLVVLLVLGVFYGCVYSNGYNEDVSRYGRWEQNTENILANSFKGSLPDSDQVMQYARGYYYDVLKSVLGDPNFVILVELQFPEESAFRKELERIKSLDTEQISCGRNVYYLLQYSDQYALEFMDDKVYDGMYYNFEFVCVNEEAKNIRYVNARVWDYHSDEELERELCAIMDGNHKE